MKSNFRSFVLIYGLKPIVFILFFAFCCIFLSLNGIAQTYNYAVNVGNAIQLNVTGANGNVQWQESTNNSTFTNISGATTNPYTFNAVASASGFRYFRAAITNTTICQNTAWYSTVVTYRIVSSSSQVQVGDWYRGGVVFSVDGSGNGLIAPTEDQSSSATWGCESVGYIASASSNTNGQANTTAIMNSCSQRPIAASICDELVYLGYSDWFLPALDQMVELIANKNIVGNFPPVQTSGGNYNNYWTSTNYWDSWNNMHSAKMVTVNGWTPSSFKDNYAYVRAIRAFSSAGSVSTTSSTVTVPFQPETVSMISQPISRNLCKGSSVSFSATALGTSISHQWKKDGNIIPNANSSWLMLSDIDAANQGVYTCEISNLCTTVTSNSATLNVIEINANAGNDIVFCNDNAISLTGIGSTNNSTVSGTLNYSWSPNIGLTDANIANPIAQPTNNQTYILTVRDGLNCSNTDTITVTSNTPISIISQTNSLSKCINSNIAIEVNVLGTDPIYQWKKDENDILDANSNIYSLTNLDLSNEGIYTCSVTNMCNSKLTNNVELKVIQLMLDAGIDTRICRGESTQLNAIAYSNHNSESGILSYAWTPSDSLSSGTIANPVANPSHNQDYTVLVSDNVGCSISDNLLLTVGTPYQNQEICLVTVDTLTGKNKIMWEKVLNVGSDRFKIFKESGTNNYVQIGEVDASLPAEFVDLGSVPDVHADRYKIMVVDTCNNASEYSSYHRTVNLVLSANNSTMGLNWTPYVDASGGFIPSSYLIYRGNNLANMSLLATVNGSTLSYNDNNVFDVYYYMIGVKKADGCEINGVLDTVSFSNKKSNSSLVGLSSMAMLYGTIQIFPNPMNNSATLSIPNFKSQNSNFKIKIYNVTGKLVRVISSSELNNNNSNGINSSSNFEMEIQRNDLNSGIYFIEVQADRVYRGKLIIE